MESTIIGALGEGALDEHGGSDHQEEMFEAMRSKTLAGLVELNVHMPAKTAKAFDGMRPI